MANDMIVVAGLPREIDLLIPGPFRDGRFNIILSIKPNLVLSGTIVLVIDTVLISVKHLVVTTIWAISYPIFLPLEVPYPLFDLVSWVGVIVESDCFSFFDDRLIFTILRGG